MRIVYFGNNWLGCHVLRWLKEQSEEIVGLVIHPEEKRKYGDEMVKTASLDPSLVLDGSRLREPETLVGIERMRPEIGLSVLFDYILKPELLSILPKGCLNLHPSYLPFNRGQYPNVWSIVEGTPIGVTLHYMDEGVDTGDVVGQQRVLVDTADTGETLYRKLEHAGLELFKRSWPRIRSGDAPRFAQPKGGTYHRARDVENIDRIELDTTYTARELIDLLRARTFPPYPGAYFEQGGRRIYLRLYLAEADEVGYERPGPLKPRED